MSSPIHPWGYNHLWSLIDTLKRCAAVVTFEIRQLKPRIAIVANFERLFQYILSSGKDSTVKLWELSTSRCLIAYTGAGTTGKIMMKHSSYARAALCIIFIRTTYCFVTWTKFVLAGKQEHRAQAVFNHTEDYVMFPDEATTSLCAWNARNASRQQLLSLGI